MKHPDTTIPIFALDASADWQDDLFNALEASVRWQQSEKGEFGPLFAFAAMTEPENPDCWEPLDPTPENLLVVSIERSCDRKVLQALAAAERVIGPALCESPDAPVQVDHTRLIADAFRQMEQAGVKVFCQTREGADDMSFFLLRGTNTVIAFNAQLRTAMRGGR